MLIAVFQFADPDMVKGFRYKLYSTVLDKEQKEKEEKVTFPVFCGRKNKQQVDSRTPSIVKGNKSLRIKSFGLV